VDRLLGENGIPQDAMAWREQFERRMEKRRRQEADGAEWQPLRRGWFLGPPEFKAQLLERMEGKLGEHHAGALKQESAEAKAERIIREELRRLGWRERDLQERPKSDPAKLALAA
jgi:hypothetical protein